MNSDLLMLAVASLLKQLAAELTRAAKTQDSRRGKVILHVVNRMEQAQKMLLKARYE